MFSNHNCPHCPPRKRIDPWTRSQCVLNKPLMMVIPYEGVHLSCPVHLEGHHVFGSSVTWMSKDPQVTFTVEGNDLDASIT